MNRQHYKRIAIFSFAWLVALSLVYLIYVKAKLLLNF